MPQEFIIFITASPLKTQAHITAIAFIDACLEKKLPIRQVFFYQDAVLAANAFASPPSNEPSVNQMWQQVVERAKIQNAAFELVTCVTASYRRGVIDDFQAQEANLEASNLEPAYSIAGLGQIASHLSERHTKLIHFN